MIRPALSRFAVIALLASVSLPAAETPVPTVIESESADMVSTDTESTFTFRNHVVVTGTNLRITCDELVVVANRTADLKATIGNQEKLKSLIATGHVRILQNDREAIGDRAEVLPGEEKATLTGNPVTIRATDNSFVQTGQRATLYARERRAAIDGGPGGRIRLTGPELKDLGYDKEKERLKSAPGNATTPAPAPQK